MAKLIKFLSPRLFGVDLGSSQIRIYDSTNGNYQNYPSLIAFYKHDQKVVGFGQDALDLFGRAESKISVQTVICDGQIYDFNLAYTMLKIILQPIFKNSFLSPDVMLSTPQHSTKTQKQAIIKLFTSLGCGKVYLISEPLAAAIGAGVPIADASGTAIFHLGADLMQGSVISLGTSLAKVTSFKAGNYADQLLQAKVLREKQLVLSVKTARKVKEQVGLLGFDSQKRVLLVSGKKETDNSPTEIELDLDFISQAILPVCENAVELLRQLLSKIPPDLTADVIDKGVLLSGGLAELVGLPTYLTKHLGVSCSVVDKSDQAVIAGIANALEHLDEFKQSLGYGEV